jgi:GT2 family glycosyltransferase
MHEQQTLEPPTTWMTPTCESGLVSVIITTFNRADELPATLDSVWAQSYRPIELIIVDDASTTDTAATLAHWQNSRAPDPAFKLMFAKLSTNSGPTVARNRAMKMASGEYIAFLDDDDRIEPDKFTHQVALLHAHHAADYTYGVTRQVLHDRYVLRSIGTPLQHDTPATNLPGHHRHTSSPLYRRQLLCEVGPWHEALRYSEDWEYAARVKAHSLQGIFDNKFVSTYRIHDKDQLIKHGQCHASHRRQAIDSVIAQLERLARKRGMEISPALTHCAGLLFANTIDCWAHQLMGKRAVRLAMAQVRRLALRKSLIYWIALVFAATFSLFTAQQIHAALQHLREHTSPFRLRS